MTHVSSALTAPQAAQTPPPAGGSPAAPPPATPPTAADSVSPPETPPVDSVWILVPPGKYLATITDSEMKPTKTGADSSLQLAFTIIEPVGYAGRRVRTWLHLHKGSLRTILRARAELAHICRAVDVLQPRDSGLLHHIPLVIQVGRTTRTQTGETLNTVKGYWHQRAWAAICAASPPCARPLQERSRRPW